MPRRADLRCKSARQCTMVNECFSSIDIYSKEKLDKAEKTVGLLFSVLLFIWPLMFVVYGVLRRG
jgi:hypothetical protein